jgi:hypothetical protein
MSGKGEGKILLGKANVYVHLKGMNNASVTHIDIELDKLNDIIYPGEKSFSGGKEGGLFLALNREMIIRAERNAKENGKEKKKK